VDVEEVKDVAEEELEEGEVEEVDGWAAKFQPFI
jgi:hypothetical protein